MIRNNIKLLLLVLFVYSQIPLFSATQVASRKKLSIKEAAERKMIDYRLSGTDGSHYGDCMAIVLQNNLDSTLNLHLAVGTELVPLNHVYQTMIVTKSATFELPALAIKSYNIFAMCGEYYDDPPSDNSVFSIGDLARNDVLKLAKYIEMNAKQNYKGQYAMWAISDQIGNKELEKYGATTIDINDVIKMFNDIGVPVKLIQTDIEDADKVSEKKNAVYKHKQAKLIYKSIVTQKQNQVKAKTHKKSVIEKYGLGGLGVLTVLSGALYLTLRRKNKKNNRRSI